jgi:hypothetical protein
MALLVFQTFSVDCELQRKNKIQSHVCAQLHTTRSIHVSRFLFCTCSCTLHKIFEIQRHRQESLNHYM